MLFLESSMCALEPPLHVFDRLDDAAGRGGIFAAALQISDIGLVLRPTAAIHFWQACAHPSMGEQSVSRIDRIRVVVGRPLWRAEASVGCLADRLQHLGRLLAEIPDHQRLAGVERADAMAARTRVAAGRYAHRLGPIDEWTADIHRVETPGIGGNLRGLVDPGRMHPRIAVMAIDAAMIDDLLGRRPELLRR